MTPQRNDNQTISDVVDHRKIERRFLGSNSIDSKSAALTCINVELADKFAVLREFDNFARMCHVAIYCIAVRGQ